LLPAGAGIIAARMPKSVPRARRRRGNALHGSTPRSGGAGRKSDTPVKRETGDPRSLLDRILDTPHLAHVVPRLSPEVLHRVIQNCGLEDCGELVTLATPGQLASVLDLDLWCAAQPGRDEQFDADRFGVWLEVLMESGAGVAAQTLAKMDADLVIGALAQHARVFDAAAGSPSLPVDDEDLVEGPTLKEEIDGEVGGYRIVATRTDSWDAIVAVLNALAEDHHEYFHRVMAGCRRLSNAGFEVDGLDDLLTDRAQVMFDLAFTRERRREQQGYVMPDQARAFLEMSRQLPLGPETTPAGNPVARAYFRAIEWTPAAVENSGSHRLAAASDAAPLPEIVTDAVATVVDLLVDAGVLPKPPRALLGGPQDEAPRLGRIQALLQSAFARDHAAYATRSQELAYLANTIVAGCSIQARPFTAQEASDAAVAICNLGLENWPPHWLDPKTHQMPDDFLVERDLVSVFQVGWKILYDRVCMHAAAQLIRVLSRLRHDDRETRTGLTALRIEMTKHWKSGTPWHARDALDVIATLDMPAWAALLGLIDECPVMHGGVAASRSSGTRAVSASAFEFISENSQIAAIQEFMRSLPDTLRG
jgi:hypothetical protein